VLTVSDGSIIYITTHMFYEDLALHINSQNPEESQMIETSY